MRALLLLAALAALQRSHALKVCVRAGLMPLSNCTLPGQLMADHAHSPEQYRPEEFAGYEVELFRDVATLLNITEELGEDPYAPGQFHFECSTKQDLFRNVGKACDIVFGGIPAATADQEKFGLLYSTPTLPSSLAVMVPSTVQTPTGWFLVDAFSWDLWLAVGLSLLIFPMLVYAAETWGTKGRLRQDGWGPHLQRSYFESGLLAVQNGVPTVTTPAARLMVLAGGVMALVLVACYTANLATYLTIIGIRSNINSIADLQGRRVGTTQDFALRLTRYNVEVVLYPTPDNWTLDQGGPGDWLSDLRAGKLAAFVYEEPIMRYVDIKRTGCELRVLDEMFEHIDYAFVFSKYRFNASAETRGSNKSMMGMVSSGFLNETTYDLVSTINWATLHVQERGGIDTLRNQFIIKSDIGCAAASSQGSSDMAITFSQVWGVWVISGGLVAIALLGLLLSNFLQRRSQPPLGSLPFATNPVWQNGQSRAKSIKPSGRDQNSDDVIMGLNA